jgi:hypothetical protein
MKGSGLYSNTPTEGMLGGKVVYSYVGHPPRQLHSPAVGVLRHDRAQQNAQWIWLGPLTRITARTSANLLEVIICSVFR